MRNNKNTDYKSSYGTFCLQKWSEDSFEVILSEYNDGNSYSASEKLSREDIIQILLAKTTPFVVDTASLTIM